jgi:predicted nucleic acid-binding protein
MLSDSGLFQASISVPLILEYEAVAKRLLDQTPLTGSDLEDILDFVCATANRQRVFYLWRPSLPDAQDDMVLEVAVAAGCEFIVTFNKRHFAGINRFGIEAVTPRELLERLGVRR